MLKLRVIPTLLYKGFTLVKGERFDGARVVGSPMQAVQIYNLRNVDELCFFDVDATGEGRGPNLELIDELADHCFMPLTVGGGVRSIDDVANLLKVGADKVAVNSVLFDDPTMLGAASVRFGAQCMVAVIDTRTNERGETTVWSHNATIDTGLDPARFAKEVEASGAGELILQSADRDGMMNGYDIDIVAAVRANVSIPVVASGGAGTFDHMVDVVQLGGADAVCAAAMFHFTEQTPMEAKQFLDARGIRTRL